MTVLHAQGGQALALVPVFLDGHGPYSFALDTGASKSTVDQKVAADLRLPVEGKSVPVSGAVANAEATLVRVQTWRVGDLPLPSRQLLTADLAALHREVGIQGLLGSDVLSRFDAVTIDYRGQRLLFQPHR